MAIHIGLFLRSAFGLQEIYRQLALQDIRPFQKRQGGRYCYSMLESKDSCCTTAAKIVTK